MESDVKNLLELLLTQAVLDRAGQLYKGWAADELIKKRKGEPARPEPTFTALVDDACEEVRSAREYVMTKLAQKPAG